MEFNEKLQELRKSRGLTQEELAEALYVSRTAISKWESGRGYPSIDSLKEIAKFFSVTIDELLSSEKVLCIAERENQKNLQNVCDLLLGIIDLMAFLLIVLPLYPKMMENYIYSVNLFAYTELNVTNQIIDWTMFVSLMMMGMIKIILNQIKIEKFRNLITNISFSIHIIMVLFLAMTRQTYAIVIAFLLLIMKGIIMMKREKSV